MTSKIERATREGFRRIWRAGAGQASAGAVQRVTENLFSRYGNSSRRYHSLTHIDYCLGQMAPVVALLEDRVAMELAVWFHDVIYDPRRTDNEERSAAYFAEHAVGVMDPTLRTRVMQLIRHTAYPYRPLATDECFIVDIDLSSFGRPWGEFLHDSENVRREYSHLSDSEYRERQLRFLCCQLERDSFCFTEFFEQRHGRRAIQNIN